MPHDFRLVGLDPAPFQPLFDLDDDTLQALGAERRIATADHGFPCRVSLQDASAGEELLLLSYQHQPAASPYRASGRIFVRRAAQQRPLAPGELPPYVTSRLMSLRAYDAAHQMVAASVCEGTQAGAELRAQFADPAVAYIHLHNAKRGCFSCLAVRA